MLPLALFEYSLPPELIAQAPAEPRDTSRLLHLPKQGGDLRHLRFTDLAELLRPGDLLVLNQTRVIKARLHLRTPHGGKVELLCFRPVDGPLTEAKTWQALGKPGSALKPGKDLVAPDGSRLVVLGRDGAAATVRAEAPLYDLMGRWGEVPLPPYIERDQRRERDAQDYQAVFAREPGAVAAPTASLHFSEALLARLAAQGVRTTHLTLHVGPGTFLPVREEHHDDVRRHVMHPEWYDVPEATQAALEATRQAGGRVIAVGTTVVRALETWAQSGAARGESTLFIYPPYEFRAVDGLITNFHLPRSTLLLLVSAFAGRERVLGAYNEAVAQRYRFFSYGDAMAIL